MCYCKVNQKFTILVLGEKFRGLISCEFRFMNETCNGSRFFLKKKVICFFSDTLLILNQIWNLGSLKCISLAIMVESVLDVVDPQTKSIHLPVLPFYNTFCLFSLASRWLIVLLYEIVVIIFSLEPVLHFLTP